MSDDTLNRMMSHSSQSTCPHQPIVIITKQEHEFNYHFNLYCCCSLFPLKSAVYVVCILYWVHSHLEEEKRDRLKKNTHQLRYNSFLYHDHHPNITYYYHRIQSSHGGRLEKFFHSSYHQSHAKLNVESKEGGRRCSK
jgi:hypothetical protein